MFEFIATMALCFGVFGIVIGFAACAYAGQIDKRLQKLENASKNTDPDIQPMIRIPTSAKYN